jgi:general secretion pathway protein D
MVRNNQPATILVGEQVPVITGTTITSGTSQTSYEYKNTGIELQVTPFITPDGLVEMIVAPSISAVESSKTQAISTNVSVPYIATRSANTVVVTPDRQPIVIGGLIDKDKETSDHKIPLLGDIPYLGALFTRHVVTDTKRELIIFLTPHVVRYSGEISGVVKTEADRFEMISKSSSEKELDKFIDEIPINMQKKSSKK